MEGNILREKDFENIYQGMGFSIGCLGDSGCNAYWLITVSERLVSMPIAIELTLDEVNEIIASNGDAKIVSRIKLSNSRYIEIEPD